MANNMSIWRVKAKKGHVLTIKIGHINNTQKNRDLALGLAKALQPEENFQDVRWICNGYCPALAELEEWDRLGL